MRALLALFLAAIASHAYGAAWVFVGNNDPYTTNYYVDSAGGNDANDGLTPATAFQTLTHVNGLTIAPWTAVYLKRGSSWTGSGGRLHIAQANIKVADYDTGALPIIDGRSTMAAGSFALVGGKSHTYSYSWSTSAAGATGSVNLNVWENGTRLTRVSTSAAVETTPGSYFIPAEASWALGVAQNLLVNPSTNDSPITNGKTYTTQDSAADRAVYLGDETHQNARLYNVEAMGGWHHNGNVQLGRNSYADGVTVRWGTIHSLYTDSGFFVNCTSYDDEMGYDFVANKGSSTDGFIEMNGCLADQQYTSGQVHGPGFFVHGVTQTTIRYINCVSRNHAIGFGINGIGQDGQQVYMSGCTATSASGPDIFHAFDINTLDFGGGHTSTVTITNCLGDGYGMFFYGFGLQANTVVSMSKCRAVVRGGNVGMQLRNGQHTSISYSSFYSTTGTSYGITTTVDGTAIDIQHCIFDNFLQGTQEFQAAVHSANQNIWHLTGGNTPTMRVANTFFGTFAAYDAAFETFTSNADPQWVEAPSVSDNFNVQPASPANSITLFAGWSNAP